VALLAGVVVVRRSFPQTTGTIVVPGLGSKVEVVRDDHGIPQIYAGTTEDLMYAEGFVHAQERFFEMDVRRHATAGRLAEMFGSTALDSDVYLRTMGWRRVAEQELPLLDPSTRMALDSYADGVNAYLADKSPGQISLEYTLLGIGGLDYTPEKWTAVDSLAWLKAMAWDLRGNMQDEIDRVETIQAVGAPRAAQLFPAPMTSTRRSSTRVPWSTAPTSKTPPRTAPAAPGVRPRSLLRPWTSWAASEGDSTACRRGSARATA
jgi:penicillin amidase